MKKNLLIIIWFTTIFYSHAQSYNAQQARDAWNAEDYDITTPISMDSQKGGLIKE